jgi:hypothetical protein
MFANCVACRELCATDFCALSDKAHAAFYGTFERQSAQNGDAFCALAKPLVGVFLYPFVLTRPFLTRSRFKLIYQNYNERF